MTFKQPGAFTFAKVDVPGNVFEGNRISVILFNVGKNTVQPVIIRAVFLDILWLIELRLFLIKGNDLKQMLTKCTMPGLTLINADTGKPWILKHRIYIPAVYSALKIEKSSVNLIEFEKTNLLQPGESQTVTVTFSIEDMASYDENNAKAYVLEKGDYVISINRDSHTVLDQKTYTADKDVAYKGDNKRASDDTAATSVFEDAKGDVTYLSRADHFANYEEATAAPASAELGEPYVSEYHLNSNFDKTTYLNDEDVMPTTGADNGLTLADMRDADYDDPRWEKLLD